MNIDNITLGSVNLGFAILIIAISIPLVKRKIKMNPWYGVRIPKSFESEENWYKINAYGGKRMIVWALLPAVVGIVAFFLPLDSDAGGTPLLAVLLAFVPLIAIIPAIIEIVIFSRKM
jgi:hypothetical protein